MNIYGYIKLSPDFFSDEAIRIIEEMPEGESVTLILFKLLCLAGKQNNDGKLTLCGVSLAPKTMATLTRYPVETVEFALDVFIQLGLMVFENHCYRFTKWEDTYEKPPKKRTEYFREYMREYRKNRKNGNNTKNNTPVNTQSPTDTHHTNNSAPFHSTPHKEEQKSTTYSAAAVNKDYIPGKGSGYRYSNIPQYVSYEQRNENGDGIILMGPNRRVVLTENQACDLIDQLGVNGHFYYADKLDAFITEKNAHVKNHYLTMLKWANEDAVLARGRPTEPDEPCRLGFCDDPEDEWEA